MEKLKPTLKNMTLVLVGVAVVVGFILAYVNHVTEGPIAEKAKATLAQGIKDVMGVDGIQVTKEDTVKTNVDGKELTYIVHETSDKSGKPVGAAVESTTTGFGGDLKRSRGFRPRRQDYGLHHSRIVGDSGTRCQSREMVPECCRRWQGRQELRHRTES